METRSHARLKHKLEEDENSPTKRIKTTKTAKETPGGKEKQRAAKPVSKGGKKKGKGKAVVEHQKQTLHESAMLEKGHIYFFYRPKVEHHEARNAGDVQKLYMVLCPQREADKNAPLGKNRLIIMASKKVPDTKKHSRHWGFVEVASDDIEDITKKLGPESYETKTLGERHVEGCRPCGSGVYSVVHHLEGAYRSNQHTHIAYVLEVPEKLGPVQHAFQIESEGSFIVTVKNPASNTAQGLTPEKRASYPKNLQDKFQSRKFIPAEPTSLLDYDGVEMIFIGAKEDIVQELGEAGKDLEETAKQEEEDEEAEIGHKDYHRCNLAEEQVFHLLHMHHKEHPAMPLIEGSWE